jgi:lipopolysaccharide transport system permease protein
MIASPIFYPPSLLSEKWRLVYAINPMVGILEGVRASLFGTAIDWQVIGISSISIVVIAVISLFVFKWMEDDFADIV